MMKRFVLGAAMIALFAACAKHDAAATAPSTPPLMIDDRGMVMPLEQAVTKISYRPWVPPGQVLKFAVIPPLGGLDTPENRGIAAEYQNGDKMWLLSEWPKQGFQLAFLHGQDITFTTCQLANWKTDGVAWTTKGKLAMTLQADGAASPKDVEIEAKRLQAAGACK